MGAHQACGLSDQLDDTLLLEHLRLVGSVISFMIPCSWSSSSSACSLSLYGNVTDCGILTQNGLTSLLRENGTALLPLSVL